MKEGLLKLIQWYLQVLARWKIRRAKPKIVAITGSYGKTSTKEAIYQLLSKKFGADVGKNWGNMNSVLGLPLAILGLRSYSFGAGLFWDIVKAKWNFLFYQMPKILVLELGIDKPNEMDQLLSVITPDVAILTGISETHTEELKNIQGVKKEKIKIIEALKKGGMAIINADDENSVDIKVPKGVRKITFGKENADISFADTKVTAAGTKFKLKIDSTSREISSKLIGAHSIYILLAAVAVAAQFSISINEITESIQEIKPQRGRMNPIKVKNAMLVIDDSYNSNPNSAIEALKTLKEIDFTGRKVAILGNMNELGSFNQEGHLLVGEAAGRSVDFFVAVGDNARYLATGAEKAGLVKNCIMIFKTTNEVIEKLNGLLSAGDLILVKASQNKMRFENIVKYLLDDAKQAEKMLVRQDKKWLQLH